MIGLISMEVAPTQISGSAHGLACAMAQGQTSQSGRLNSVPFQHHFPSICTFIVILSNCHELHVVESPLLGC